MTSDSERIAVLEANYRHVTEKIDGMAMQLTEVHDMLLKAKGARWAILAMAGGAGFLSAKAGSLATWLGIAK